MSSNDRLCLWPTAPDEWRFEMEGAFGEVRRAEWDRPVPRETLPESLLFVIEYEARGLLRERQAPPVLALAGQDADGCEIVCPLAEASDLLCDGRTHRLLARRAPPRRPLRLTVRLATMHAHAFLHLRAIGWAPSPEALPGALSTAPSDGSVGSYAPLDLAAYFNAGLGEVLRRRLAAPGGAILDGGRFPDGPRIVVEGIPFCLGPVERNLIRPGPPPSANAEIIERFGIRAARGRLAPISRDDAITLSIGRTATEICLLLAADMPARRRSYFVADRPMFAADAECFVVEIVYDDGRREEAFPYSIRDGRPIIQRLLTPYVVPADGSQVREIVCRNRLRDADFCVAAVTVNHGPPRFAEAFAPPPRYTPRAREIVASRVPTVARTDDGWRLENAQVVMDVRATPAFEIAALSHAALGREAPAISPGAVLDVTLDGKAVSGDALRVVEERAEGMGLLLRYRIERDDAVLEARIEASLDAAEARLRLALSNLTDRPLAVEARWPILRDVRWGAPEDAHYFFPQYRNALSAAPARLSAEAGFAFPMPFMAAFDPKAGGGLYVIVLDRARGARRYDLAKTASGVSMGVAYPAGALNLPPRSTALLPDTRIGLHLGDWRAAADRYRCWRDTWYRPWRSQDKPWFRRSFLLLAEIADGLDDDLFRLPAWYDAAARRVRFREILDEFERRDGRRPDILHLWAWAFHPECIIRWGAYDAEDYAQVGGLDALRAAIADIQTQRSIPMSLYINATLCNCHTPIFRALGESAAVHDASGTPKLSYTDSFRMCHGVPGWREHMRSLYERVARETGAAILYVDEIAHRVGNRCHAPHHGHAVPSNLTAHDYDFMRAIRAAAPPAVALYGEYPAPDTVAQFLDGCIHYYFHDEAESLFCPTGDHDLDPRPITPVALNLYRFLFPREMHLDLPLGLHHGSWHDLKFTFFNGEALYETFWVSQESRGHDFLRRAHAIKKAWSDCFASDAPEMLAPTERGDVAANRFPGDGRTVWTLYNAGARTARGAILRVPHRKGCAYRDLWNDRPLEPEIREGWAILALDLPPHGIGCVAQTGADGSD